MTVALPPAHQHLAALWGGPHHVGLAATGIAGVMSLDPGPISGHLQQLGAGWLGSGAGQFGLRCCREGNCQLCWSVGDT